MSALLSAFGLMPDFFNRIGQEQTSVAGGDQERQRPPQIVCQRVDFGRAPAARAADRVMEGPPFAPAAERWTLMCVLSIDMVPTMPVEPVSA